MFGRFGNGFQRISDYAIAVRRRSGGGNVTIRLMHGFGFGRGEKDVYKRQVVVGDNRPFIGALVTLDPEGLAAWLPSVGLSADTPLDRIATVAAVHDEIQKYVDKANATVSRAESVRKFVVLNTQFTQENKCLTPSLKVVRPAVNRDVYKRQA